MKTGHLARRLNLHPNTARQWARDYAEFLSDKANAGRRDFSDSDALVIATVANLREQGLLHEQIVEALRSGTRVKVIPDLPTPEEQAAREQIALIPASEYERLVDRLHVLQTELEQARGERDNAIERWQGDTTALNERIARLEHTLGVAEGELRRLEGERPSVMRWLAILAVAVVVVAVAVYLLSAA